MSHGAKGRVLFAGNFEYEFREPAMAKALRSLGWEVEQFSWWDYIPGSVWGKIQDKYLFGPAIRRINEALIEQCKSLIPDVVFIYKGIYVWPQTIAQIKHCARLVVSWNPDNPFGNYDTYAKRYTITGNALLRKVAVYDKVFHFRRLWINFVRSIPLYDICFVYRRQNITKYQNVGAKQVYLLRSFYVPELHRPAQLTEGDRRRLGSDTVFIGHFEPDHRMECIEAMLEAGVHVRLFGTGWNRYLSGDLRKAFGPTIRPLYGDDYVKALCASKIALCFMSKLNRNTYTRRIFEIPACGTLLLSERTDEMKELFEEDKEAVYFSDKEELVQKVQLLLEEPEKRNAIAIAGHRRCISSGYDVVSRMRGWNDIVCAKLNILPSLTTGRG